MNRMFSVAFRVAVAALILISGANRAHAQAQPPLPLRRRARRPATPPPSQPESFRSSARSPLPARNDGIG